MKKRKEAVSGWELEASVCVMVAKEAASFDSAVSVILTVWAGTETSVAHREAA